MMTGSITTNSLMLLMQNDDHALNELHPNAMFSSLFFRIIYVNKFRTFYSD